MFVENPRSIDRAIADLTASMEQYGATHPRALKLAAMIDGLREFRDRASYRGVSISMIGRGGSRSRSWSDCSPPP
jgi:hypothetical protein